MTAVVATAFLVAVLLVGASQWAEREVRLRDEFAHLHMPDKTTMLATQVFSRVLVGISISATYRSSLTDGEVETFYGQEMAANGWVPISSRRVQPEVSCFAKNDLRAAVEFPGKSGAPWGFVVDVAWGSSICD